jgi:hypothetical protein
MEVISLKVSVSVWQADFLIINYRQVILQTALPAQYRNSADHRLLPSARVFSSNLIHRPQNRCRDGGANWQETDTGTLWRVASTRLLKDPSLCGFQAHMEPAPGRSDQGRVPLRWMKLALAVMLCRQALFIHYVDF